MNLSAYLKSYIPAIVVCLAIAALLRPVTAPLGLKTGIAFAAFIIVHALVSDRVRQHRRSPRAWAITLVMAMVTVFAMWLINPA